jgi:hypothetical protein
MRWPARRIALLQTARERHPTGTADHRDDQPRDIGVGGHGRADAVMGPLGLPSPASPRSEACRSGSVRRPGTHGHDTDRRDRPRGRRRGRVGSCPGRGARLVAMHARTWPPASINPYTGAETGLTMPPAPRATLPPSFEQARVADHDVVRQPFAHIVNGQGRDAGAVGASSRRPSCDARSPCNGSQPYPFHSILMGALKPAGGKMG